MAKYSPTRAEQQRLIKHLLWVSQDGKCKICKKDKTENGGVIEHHNGDKADYSPENIGFVCYSCNQRKRPDYCQQGSVSSGKSVCVNTNAEATDSEQYRDRIRIKKAPLEIEINRDSEPTVRRYLWENIGRSEGLTVEDAVNESAEKADCSPVTSRRHIMKACSLAGPFKIEEFQNKDYILLRDGYSPSLQSRLGQLDSQIMKERIAKAEEEKRQKEQELLAKAEQLKETEEQQQKLTKSFNKKCLEVELLQKLLKTKYGLTEEQIQKELGGMTKVLVNNEDKTTSQRPHGI